MKQITFEQEVKIRFADEVKRAMPKKNIYNRLTYENYRKEFIKNLDSLLIFKK